MIWQALALDAYRIGFGRAQSDGPNQGGMNRIRELREARGLSAADLADLVGTSQPQITRLERGERRLTADWMTRLARALNCTPADLMAAATLAGLAEDVAPYVPEGAGQAAAVALGARNLGFYEVRTDALEQIGLVPGSVILIDLSQTAVDAVKTGDVVLVQLYDPDPMRLAAHTVLRQFIAPGLLVTNRRTNNLVVTMINDSFEAHIKGVMVPQDKPAITSDDPPPDSSP